MPVTNLWLLEAGHCTHPEFTVIEGGSRKHVRFPATVAVIEHSSLGVFLFDTGYSPRFHEQTRKLPEKLYALTTPVFVRPEETALHQLKAKGIRERDISHVILSHFHADHVAGVADFSHSTYVYQGIGYDAVSGLSSLGRTRAGFLAGLLPDDFNLRSRKLGADSLKTGVGIAPFGSGWDITGDGSIVLVDLPGHTKGHSGLLVQAPEGVTYFLVADACWTSRAYREMRMPHPITALIMDSRSRYRQTLEELQTLSARRPDVRIVPCHCSEAQTSIQPLSARAATA
jgi:glyoxylase-like metal-dependent hydrolase (beta-lactamase superfamily II)